MNALNMGEYKRALKILPELMGIAFNTFHNYRKLSIDAKADIPYHMVLVLEAAFGLKPGELSNCPVEQKTLQTLIKEGYGIRNEKIKEAAEQT